MANVPFDDLGVDHQTFCDVLQSAEDDVCGQEGLWEGDPPVSIKEKTPISLKAQSDYNNFCYVSDNPGEPVSTVVQRPLKPLDRSRLQRVGHQRHQVTCQAAAAF